MDKLVNYLRETRVELRHVSWPTKRQALIYTALVIGISIVVSLFVGFFDYIFTKGLNLFIGS